MLQKVVCGYTISVNKFKSDPSAAIAEAQGDAVAVSSNDEIQFYAVPAELFEDMAAFCEFAQRGTTEQKNISAKFVGEELDMEEVANSMSTKIKNGTSGDFEEW